jgi:ketosteroid isomerase-like protein
MMRVTVILLCAVLLGGCERPAAKPAQASPEVELRAANAEYNRALIDGDAGKLDGFYTEDYRIIGDDGEVYDRKDRIHFMSRIVDLLQARGDDVQVATLAADSAVLTGRFSGRYRMDGKDTDFAERFTTVWVREGGAWRVRHEHVSMIPPADRPPER